MSRHVVIAGGGEHARVVAEAAVAGGWELLGYTAPGVVTDTVPGSPAGLPRLGTDADLARSLTTQSAEERPWLVLGFGGPSALRRQVVAWFGPEASWATVIHPAAWVSPSASVAPGAVILAGAVVNSGAVIGPHAIVNSGVIVEHDVRLGAHGHVAPGATIGGGAHIGDDAFIGLGASVRDHVAVGIGAVVGMGAAVVCDVPEGVVVTGVPARVTDAVVHPGAAAHE